MAGGRPTDYSKSILKKTEDYIESCQDIEVKKGLFTKLKVRLPTIEGLAVCLKVHRDTIYQWEKEYPEFSDILEQLRAKQAERLLNMSLSGDYNSTIAKVLLTKHGYHDKQEIEHGNSTEKPFIFVVKPDK
jgi:hypothetical protein